jgi:hypothetical protein
MSFFQYVEKIILSSRAQLVLATDCLLYSVVLIECFAIELKFGRLRSYTM